MDDILSTVRSSLNESVPNTSETASGNAVETYEEQAQVEVYQEEADEWYDRGDEFDDTGEGAGVEGDLDKEDDE